MSESDEKGKEATNPSNPLQIDKTVGEIMTRIPKGVFKKASHNPNARVAQNYSVVEDMEQTPCMMSSLEVLQICPSQRKNLLSSLGATETSNPGVIIVDRTKLKPLLTHHIAFHIVVAYTTKYSTWNIFRTVVNEGALTCMMSLACWKAIGQHEFSSSPKLIMSFGSQSFIPHKIIPSFPM
jgi:hypothetical protein